METYDEIYKHICRICLSYSTKVVNLFDSSSEDGLNCYGKSVQTFAHISLQNFDNLPSVMCSKCLYLLKQAIRFKLICETTDKQLKMLTNLGSVSPEKNNDISKKIIQYVMFNLYFPNDSASDISFKGCNTKILSEISQTDLCDTEIDELDLSYNEVQENSQFKTVESALEKLENSMKTNKEKLNMSYKHLRKRKHRNVKHLTFTKSHKLNKKTKRKSDNKEPWICHICQRTLSNHATYKNHMDRHNGCRFMCEHCGKVFPVLSELQVHQVSIHGTGQYLQCQYCSFKAPRKFILIEHERLHTGERPYACEKCGLTFRRKGLWKKHLIYHTEKKVQCPQCPRRFFKRSEMLAHANSIHERVYLYSCNVCGATYAKTATVRKHLTEKHGIPREEQGKIIRINKGSMASISEQ